MHRTIDEDDHTATNASSGGSAVPIRSTAITRARSAVNAISTGLGYDAGSPHSKEPNA